MHYPHFLLPVCLSALIFPSTLSLSGGEVAFPRLSRRAISKDVLLSNGKAAQKLNAKFVGMKADASCKTGENACIGSSFSQCVAGKYVGTPCGGGTKCYAMPLLLREGTTLGCDTEADATARIIQTGATGGLTGDSEATGQDNSSTPSASGINGTSTGASGDPEGSKSQGTHQPTSTSVMNSASNDPREASKAIKSSTEGPNVATEDVKFPSKNTNGAETDKIGATESGDKGKAQGAPEKGSYPTFKDGQGEKSLKGQSSTNSSAEGVMTESETTFATAAPEEDSGKGATKDAGSSQRSKAGSKGVETEEDSDCGN